MTSIQKIIDFYQQLADNNNKPWFDAHKAQYQEVKILQEAFAMDCMHRIEAFDHRVHDLTIKDITYRIYRDVRFSQDKSPYKHWWGVYVCPHGKKSGMAGYYVHFEPANNQYFVCGGLYNPTKEVLNSVRECIMLEPDKFDTAVKTCGQDFHMNWDAAMKRMPLGYKESDKCSQYYRLRSYEIYKPLTKHDVLKHDFLDKAIADLQKTYQLTELLNVCYDYAYDKD